MGLVFKARRQSDGEAVALKSLRVELGGDDVSRRRFMHEARSATEVRHPHLVPLLEVGEDQGNLFLVMPFYEGGTLADRIAAGPLDIAAALRYVAQIAAAVDALHAQAIVHRDLKPSNVLLDASGAHVSDFGLSKGSAYTALTMPGQKLGTFDYMAPEIIGGQPAGPPSDIYALGCIAFECLAGKPPFAGRPLFQLALAHLEDDPPDLASMRPDVGAELNWAITRALAKDPAERPPTATAYAHMAAVAGAARAPAQGTDDR